MTTALYIDWGKKARTKQLRPLDDHFIWLVLAGRGWGKTRCGAQDCVLYALKNPGVNCAVVCPTHSDLRRVAFNGSSGLMSIIPKELLLEDGKQAGYSLTQMRSDFTTDLRSLGLRPKNQIGLGVLSFIMHGLMS